MSVCWWEISWIYYICHSLHWTKICKHCCLRPNISVLWKLSRFVRWFLRVKSEKETLAGLQWMTSVLITTFHKRTVWVSTNAVETRGAFAQGMILSMWWCLSCSFRPRISMWAVSTSYEMHILVQQSKTQVSLPLAMLLPNPVHLECLVGTYKTK